VSGLLVKKRWLGATGAPVIDRASNARTPFGTRIIRPSCCRAFIPNNCVCWSGDDKNHNTNEDTNGVVTRPSLIGHGGVTIHLVA